MDMGEQHQQNPWRVKGSGKSKGKDKHKGRNNKGKDKGKGGGGKNANGKRTGGAPSQDGAWPKGWGKAAGRVPNQNQLLQGLAQLLGKGGW